MPCSLLTMRRAWGILAGCAIPLSCVLRSLDPAWLRRQGQARRVLYVSRALHRPLVAAGAKVKLKVQGADETRLESNICDVVTYAVLTTVCVRLLRSCRFRCPNRCVRVLARFIPHSPVTRHASGSFFFHYTRDGTGSAAVPGSFPTPLRLRGTRTPYSPMLQHSLTLWSSL